MRAYVIESGGPIHPFAERAATLPVGAVESLQKWQSDLFARFGLERVAVARAEDVPADDEPKLVTKDDVFFTRRILKDFLKRWGPGRRSVRLALPLESTFVECFDALQDFERAPPYALFDFWGVAAGTAFDGAGEPLPVIYEERVIEMPVPERITGIPHWRHPVTTSVCLHVRHWLHVLQVNRLSIQVRWVDIILRRPFWAAFILVRGLLFGRGRLLWRVLGSANVVGRNVDIHPTARVEGCIIEEGARIGAQALVRCSIIGARANVEERANVAYSVIGADTYVSKYTLVYSSVTMEGANVGASMQMCLVGRRSATTPRSTPTDVLPGSTIKVKTEGEVVDTGLHVLGPVIGHDCFIGADLYIAPGRAIPSGTKIGPHPSRILSQVPEETDPEQSYVVVDGKLTPLPGSGE